MANGLNEGDGECTIEHTPFLWSGNESFWVTMEPFCHFKALGLIRCLTASLITVLNIFTDKCLDRVKKRWGLDKETIKIHNHVVFNFNLSVQLQPSAQLTCLTKERRRRLSLNLGLRKECDSAHGQRIFCQNKITEMEFPGLLFSWHPDDQGSRHNWQIAAVRTEKWNRSVWSTMPGWEFSSTSPSPKKISC